MTPVFEMLSPEGSVGVTVKVAGVPPLTVAFAGVIAENCVKVNGLPA